MFAKLQLRRILSKKSIIGLGLLLSLLVIILLNQPRGNAVLVREKSGGVLTVLNANVGNSSLGCRNYKYNLCNKRVEARIAANIASLQPDIVALQEVLHPDQCAEEGIGSFWTRNLACPDDEAAARFQVRRLVGPDYSIACSPRYGYECLAVHKDAGVIDGCALGELCEDVGRVDVPLRACDDGFTTMSVAAVIRDKPVTLVNAHLSSSDAACRIHSLRQIFEGIDGASPLIGDGNALLMGDFNFDPFRQTDESIELWHQYVGGPDSDRPFRYHSGLVERDPPHYTFRLLWLRSTLDHVASNFARGICITLGENESLGRLDGGRGMDHRALWCELTY